MDLYDVKVFPTAQTDIIEITKDPCERSSGRVPQFLEALMDAADILRIAPEQFPPAKDIQFRLRGYRILPVGDYIGFYTVREKTVGLCRLFFARDMREDLF